MIEVAGRYMVCTLLTPDYSQMPAVALQLNIAPFSTNVLILRMRLLESLLYFLQHRHDQVRGKDVKSVQRRS